MTINMNNLPAHELIGLKVKVAHTPDPSLRGFAGVVRDESRNMIYVESRDRLFSIPKKGFSFSFELPDGNMATIEGLRLRFRPEDRVRKGLRSW